MSFTLTVIDQNLWRAIPGASTGKNLPVKAGDARSIPGSGRSLGEGNGNPLQYSCLDSPMDRGAWWTTIPGVTELDTSEPLTNHHHHLQYAAALAPDIVTCPQAGNASQIHRLSTARNPGLWESQCPPGGSEDPCLWSTPGPPTCTLRQRHASYKASRPLWGRLRRTGQGREDSREIFPNCFI